MDGQLCGGLCAMAKVILFVDFIRWTIRSWFIVIFRADHDEFHLQLTSHFVNIIFVCQSFLLVQMPFRFSLSFRNDASIRSSTRYACGYKWPMRIEQHIVIVCHFFFEILCPICFWISVVLFKMDKKKENFLLGKFANANFWLKHSNPKLFLNTMNVQCMGRTNETRATNLNAVKCVSRRFA